MHVYPFAFLQKVVVAETAACLCSFTVTKAKPTTENRAICEQKGNSASSQEHIPAGYAFTLTSGTVIYLASCVDCNYVIFLLTLQKFAF